MTEEYEHVTFSEFLAEFRQDFGGWSDNTWRGNSGLLKKLSEEFGHEHLREIKPRQIDGYLSRRRREGLTPATTNRYLATLKVLFGVAKLWGYLDESPACGIRMLKEQGKVPQALTEGELDALLGQCREDLRAIVLIAGDTGMRRSELQRLTWGDVDVTVQFPGSLAPGTEWS